MSNPVNNGTLVGRLARDPKVFENSDGSKKVVFTVFAQRNYKSAQGETLSDAIPVEAFVRKSTEFAKTPFANIHKGDLVGLNTALQMDHFNRGGDEVFELKVIVEDITFLESRSVTQARLAERVSEAEKVNAAAREAVSGQVQTQAPAEASAVQSELPF